MGLIPLVEYAKIYRKDRHNLTRMATNDRFETAVKQGRDWFIDLDEPSPEDRRKSNRKEG